MRQTLTLELSEQVFTAIQHQAQAIGILPAQLVASLLEQRFTKTFKVIQNEADRDAARERFERHFGTLTLEDSIDLDNESIDADLAREYANTHEDQ